MNNCKLGDVTRNLDSKRIPLSKKQREHLKKVYPYYGAQDIVDYVDDYLFDGTYLLVAEDGENLKSRKSSIANLATGKFWVNNHAHILGEKEGTNIVYIYYLLRELDLSGYISGSAQPKLTQERLSEVELPLPSKNIQDKIVLLLSLLDRKINNNSLIFSELESQSKTLYDYWFVQFDFPNESGKPYRTSGGEMVWNDQLKREIPKGWGAGNLYDIAEFINGLACQKYRPSEGEASLPVIKITEMHDGITDNTERVSINIPTKNKIADGDILFSWSATLEVMYWFGGNGGLNQHIFKVEPKRDFSKEYIYHQLSAYVINFVKMAEARKTTMGHITSDHLQQSRIVLPPKKYIDDFTKVIKPIHEKLGKVQQENRELTKLRDWLLPMLMNGQATV